MVLTLHPNPGPEYEPAVFIVVTFATFLSILTLRVVRSGTFLMVEKLIWLAHAPVSPQRQGGGEINVVKLLQITKRQKLARSSRYPAVERAGQIVRCSSIRSRIGENTSLCPAHECSTAARLYYTNLKHERDPVFVPGECSVLLTGLPALTRGH